MSLIGQLRSQAAAELRRWLREEPPGAVYAAGGLPPSIREMQRLTSAHRLAGLLPYESFEPETRLFHTEDAIGWTLEVAPGVGLSEESLRVLSGLFTLGLKAGTTVQVTLYASPDIRPLLERWAARKQGGIYEFLARKRTDYLARGAWRSLLGGQPFLLRDYRLFLSVLRPAVGEEREWLLRTRDAMRGILSSARMPAEDLDAAGLINLLDTILNPAERREPIRWEDSRLLREQMVDNDTLLLVGRDGLGLSHGDLHLDVRPYTVRQYPQSWAGWGMGDLIGDLFENSLRIPCPFLHTQTLHVPDQLGAGNRAKLKAARAQQMAESPVGRFLPAWRERQRDWEIVARRMDDGHQLFQVHSQLVLFAPQGEGDYAEQRLTALYGARGWKLSRDRFTSLHAFLTALPLMPGPAFIREMRSLGRLRSFLTWNCVHTAPWMGEWRGTGTPLLQLVGRRGQIMHLDPWDNRQGNYNIAVAAASGAGKSVFSQEMLFNLLGAGGRAWVIDRGRSYQRLCQLVGGSYLEFSSDSRVNLNPFSGIHDFDEDVQLMLRDLLAQMAAPETPLDSLRKGHLERTIKAVWRAHGREASITRVAEALLERPEEPAREVGHMLYPYTREGAFGRWFEGEANIDLDNPLVVLELGELDAKPDLQAVVVLMLMMRIAEAMYLGDRSRRKLCIIDEAWKLMGRGNAGDFIEGGYRTARKHGGAFMTITQGIDDYHRSGTSKAALANADWVFLLRQKEESLKAAESNDQLVMDGHLRTLLASVDTQEGEYSEIAVRFDGATSVGRLVVDRFSELLFTTKGEEYEAIEQMRRQGLGLVEALERLAEMKGQR